MAGGSMVETPQTGSIVYDPETGEQIRKSQKNQNLPRSSIFRGHDSVLGDLGDDLRASLHPENGNLVESQGETG